MNASVIFRGALAIAFCVAVIVLDAMWDDIFFADFKSYEMLETKLPSGEVVATGVAHLFRTPSTLEAVARIAAPFLALAGVGAYVALLVSDRKIAVGGLASAFGAMISISVVQGLIGNRLNSGTGRYLMLLIIWGGIAFGIGVLAAWTATVWWPNKSLERTREG